MSAPSSAANRFFDQARAHFEQAARQVGLVERHHDLLGQPVRVLFAGSALVQPLSAALAHRTIASSSAPALTICAWDARSTGVGLPPAPWPPTAYGAKGVIDGFNDDRFSTVFAPGVDLFNMFDRQGRVGLFWIDDASSVPYWESGFPFRTLLHWSTAGRPVQLVHGGAVGIGGAGVLITGVGGSGKSTTTLLCLDAGLGYAGDDYVAFELGTPPRVHSLYSTAKVDERTLALLPWLQPMVSNTVSSEEKGLVFLHESHGDRLSPGFDVKAVLLPTVRGRRDTRLVAATPAAAIRALAPTTVFQLPRQDREAFASIVELTRRVPAFHLELGTELEQIAPTVAGVIEGRCPG